MFSTSVEMILIVFMLLDIILGVLYECGDDPKLAVEIDDGIECSLRVWR